MWLLPNFLSLEATGQNSVKVGMIVPQVLVLGIFIHGHFLQKIECGLPSQVGD